METGCLYHFQSLKAFSGQHNRWSLVADDVLLVAGCLSSVEEAPRRTTLACETQEGGDLVRLWVTSLELTPISEVLTCGSSNLRFRFHGTCPPVVHNTLGGLSTQHLFDGLDLGIKAIRGPR